jgi:hypothetical protein
VSGDRLLLSGNKGVICLRWKDYDRIKFDPDDESSVFWPEPLPQLREAANVAPQPNSE